MSVSPFEVHVSDQVLSDLSARLERTRFLHNDDADDWSAGTNHAYVKALVSYWQTEFDWREQERQLNEMPNFTTLVDGNAIHFVHERGVGPDPMPIVLSHGFPDSYLRFRKMLPLLTNPGAHGADARDAFHVVVPSLPGYAFSGSPNSDASIFSFGKLIHKLMKDELGYERYAAHGGDWGAIVAEQLARDNRDSLIGIHLTEVPFWHALQPPDDLKAPEAKFLADNREKQKHEGAYALIQGTRPQTLADSLNDSPAGLATWLLEKFQSLSDSNADIERVFTKDELLTNIMLYWANASIGTSFLPYYDVTNAGIVQWLKERGKNWVGASHVPAAFALFPADLTHPPKMWAERYFNVERWTEMERGGHFAAHEEPEILARDIREFYRPFRVYRRGS